MLVLDTDHLTEYQKGQSTESQRLKERLDAANVPYATTIITVEEVMRDWMAAVRRTRDARRQIHAYSRLNRLFQFFATWNVLPWDSAAVDRFESLKAAKVRVGTMDLKIAAICLANDATLLTRNAVDFAQVSGLPMED